MDNNDTSLLPGPHSTSVADDLLAFYDEFVEFQGCCAFLCDAVTAMVNAPNELDEASVHGVNIFSSQVKQRAQLLKNQLQALQKKSLE